MAVPDGRRRPSFVKFKSHWYGRMENFFPVGNNFGGEQFHDPVELPPDRLSFPYRLDLVPYGINVVITPQMTTDELDLLLTIDNVRGARKNTDASFIINDTKYTIERFEGSGTYGEVYSCRTPSIPSALVCKIINVTSVRRLLREVIIQIILMKYTEKIETGSFVPILYAVGFDRTTNKGYIISEKMDKTLEKLIKGNTKAQNEEDIPIVLNEIAVRLHYTNPLKFNHRDLKIDNVMFNYTADGYKNYKLIDFGDSCLTFGNLYISATKRYSEEVCYKEGRDLGQLIFDIYISSLSSSNKESEHDVITKKMQHWLENLLEINGKYIFRNKPLTYNWSTLAYKLLEEGNVNPRYTTPAALVNKTHRYVNGKPFEGGGRRRTKRSKARAHNHQ